MTQPHRATGSTLSIAEHPILRELRVVREPRSRVLRVVEALCRFRTRPHPPDPNWRPQLPTDSELARELGISPSAVRNALDEMALLLEGLEVLGTRQRIYVWYHHQRWQRGER